MSNMYDILGKLKSVFGTEAEPVETTTEPVYETVEPRGDIMEAVHKIEEKYMGFKKTDEAIDPELLKAAGVGLATGALIPAASNLGYKAAEKIDKWLDKRSSAAAKKEYEAERQARLAKKSKKVAEGEYDPAPIDPEAVAKRKRLQALKDKAEDEQGYSSAKSNVRTVKGKAYGGAAQKDAPEADDLDEVAPPGAKAERMVKHIKKGYAKDGKLTKREKGIAYATAWKAHNKGQVEEGTQFGDTIKNSEAKLTKAKKVKVTESRMLQEGDYFYEKVGKALAEKNPTLDTASPDFVTAVRQEMVAHGIEPNRARNIIMMDDDFISDVATSYSHYCQEIAECGAPINSHLGGAMEELDEIARLAGLQREGNAFTGKLAATPKGGEFELDGKTYKDTSGLGETAVEEAEVEEGNEYTKARLDAIRAGKDTFTVGGKIHSVTGDTSQEKVQVEESEQVNEDVTITVSTLSNDDSVDLIRKLAGLGNEQLAQPAAPAQGVSGVLNTDGQVAQLPMVDTSALPDAEVAEERDIEWDNTPDEQTAPISAAIPSGNDLHKSKIQDPRTANKAANPLKDKELEESLWKKYEDMINDIKA